MTAAEALQKLLDEVNREAERLACQAEDRASRRDYSGAAQSESKRSGLLSARNMVESVLVDCLLEEQDKDQ